jgi:hypothetical protein
MSFKKKTVVVGRDHPVSKGWRIVHARSEIRGSVVVDGLHRLFNVHQFIDKKREYL